MAISGGEEGFSADGGGARAQEGTGPFPRFVEELDLPSKVFPLADLYASTPKLL